ncbi:MAG: WYL domain-containing protein [Candidatus Mcinerneyibacterium aminivorans]|uniref:WYL domain-containing protein n=1 Tax=Candidatus Mcinerneyibacterium aminivorans TaxID=2703815 RepID=A0A5D0ML32_9BACT|nr:MAG: WYL domain-containing protein [Candidatus Mcinerneyibacterium aminivorans]
MDYMKSNKITFHVPGFIHELLKADIDKYKISQGTLCNIIFETFYNDYKKWSFGSNLEKTINFKLKEKNYSVLNNLLENKKIEENKSKYFRNLLVTYLDNKPYHRERIVYKNNIDKIFKAIKDQKNVAINYKDEERTLEPYSVKTTKEELFNYLLCYCYKHQEYRTYRISNIKVKYVKKEDWQHYNEKKIENLSENFDPFLSRGKKLKVKFTGRGKDLFENVIFYNRPEVIKRKGNIYILQCSLEKAKAYFASFFDEVEILEPDYIRNHFAEKYQHLSEIYNNS